MRDEVTTITTPGETVDVVVTERGIAVADRHADLKKELLRRRLPLKDIRQLQAESDRIPAQAARLADTAALFHALGGRW